jgi:hypothetical protein
LGRERSSIPAKIIFNDHLLSFCTNDFPFIHSHGVQAYEKKDGTKVTRSIKKDFCKNKFPKLESWQERFTDGKIKGWDCHNSSDLKIEIVPVIYEEKKWGSPTILYSNKNNHIEAVLQLSGTI